jgi:hypothetical protein
MNLSESKQPASLGKTGFFKILQIARGIDKSHRLGTKTMIAQVNARKRQQ